MGSSVILSGNHIASRVRWGGECENKYAYRVSGKRQGQ